jgi:hypothetical protein
VVTGDNYSGARTEVRASDDLDPAPLETVASAQVVEGTIALFERQRESGQGAIETDVSLHETVTAEQADSATIEDCVLLAPSFTDTVGVWHEADLVRTEEGWVVDAVRVPSAGGCVPKEMADSAIAGYQAYYDARSSFWDPERHDGSRCDPPPPNAHRPLRGRGRHHPDRHR